MTRTVSRCILPVCGPTQPCIPPGRCVVSSTLELYREFTEDAYSIALHPTGLWALVGFSDKLRLMNIFIDDIRPAHEFNIRGCREVGRRLYTLLRLLLTSICCGLANQSINQSVSHVFL